MADSVAGASADPHDTPDPSRRNFIHIAAITAAAGGAAAIAWPFIDQMNPSADTLALSSIEYDVSKVPLGQQVTVLYRKQPLFVRHRTPAEIAKAVADDHAPMKDPATDASRVKPGKSEWLILIGVCTHLGCTPTVRAGRVGRLVLPLPRLAVRHRRPHPQRSRAAEPRAAGLHVHRPTPRSKSADADHGRTFAPTSRKTAFERWLDARLPIVRFGKELLDFPTPKNLNYWWTFGGILAFCLGVQIAHRHRAGDALRTQSGAGAFNSSSTSCAT